MNQAEGTMDASALAGIARLEVWSGGKFVRWGSAFLITPRHAISACHVIVPPKSGPESSRAESFKLVFGNSQGPGEDGAGRIERWVRPVPGASEARLDWVLLEFDTPVSQVNQPILRGLRGQDRAPFQSFGYCYRDKGLMLSGHVELAGVRTGDISAIQLFSVQAAADVHPQGQSGAPVYSGGVVIGVVRSFLKREGAVLGGTLYACDIEDVLRHPLVAALARRDPCVGLPALPPDLSIPEDPFRYLKPYSKDDARLFFGRCRDIGALAKHFENPWPITLLYGPTGVGKSSLLHAGIHARFGNRFDIRIKRRSAARGLAADLADALTIPAGTLLEFEQAWRALEQSGNGGDGPASVPMLVILDQIEEAWTLPLAGGIADPARAGHEEMDELCRRLQLHFADSGAGAGTRVVLSFRKEWLTEVEAALQRWNLPASAHALVPIDGPAIEEIVAAIPNDPILADKYRLQVKPEVSRQMAEDISSDSNSAKAPILQILLTDMWNAARARNLAEPVFDIDLYRTCRKQGAAIGDFIADRLTRLPAVDQPAIATGAVLELLYLHTTEAEGTGGVASKRSNDELSAYFGDRAPQMISLANALVNVDLLHDATAAGDPARSARRLAHDVMAPPIRHQYGQSQLPGPRATRILQNAKVDWMGEHVGSPLSAADLKIVESGLTARRMLDAPEQRLLNASRDAAASAERSKRNRKIGGVVVAAIIVTVTLAAAYFNIMRARSTQELRVTSTLSEARAIRSKQPTWSLQLVKEAMNVSEVAGLQMSSVLEGALRDSLAEIGGHSLGNIGFEPQSVSMSDGGEWVAVTGHVGEACLPLRLWRDTGSTYAKFLEFERTAAWCGKPQLSADGRWLAIADQSLNSELWRRHGDGASAEWKIVTDLRPIVGDTVFSRDSQWLYVVARRKKGSVAEAFDAYRLGDDGVPRLVGHHPVKIDVWGLSRSQRLAYALDTDTGILTVFSLPEFRPMGSLEIGKEETFDIAVADSGRHAVVLYSSTYKYWSRENTASAFREISTGPHGIPIEEDHRYLDMEMSPNERWVAVTGSPLVLEGTTALIRLDPENPRIVRAGRVDASATYSEDGRWLVLAATQASEIVDLVELESTGRLARQTLAGTTSPATFTPEGRLVTGSSGPGLLSWKRGLRVSKWERDTTLKGHDQQIANFVTDAARTTLVSWEINGEARLTRLIEAQAAVEPRLVRKPKHLTDRWLPALHTVANATAEDIESVIDSTRRSVVADARGPYSARKEGIETVIGQSADKSWSLVVRGQEESKTAALLVNTRSPRRETCSGDKVDVFFAPAGSEAWVICNSEGRQELQIHDLRASPQMHAKTPKLDQGLTLVDMAYSPDSLWVAVLARGGDRKQQVVLFDRTRSDWWDRPIATGIRGQPESPGIDFDPKSRWLLLDAVTMYELWDLASSPAQVVAHSNDNGFPSLAKLSPDGRWLAYAAYRVTPSERAVEVSAVELPESAGALPPARAIFSQREASAGWVDFSFGETSRWLLVTTPRFADGLETTPKETVTAQLFDRESGWARVNLPTTPGNEADAGRWIARFGAGDRWLAIGRELGSDVSMLDLHRRTEWVRFNGMEGLRDIAISPDGDRLAALGATIRLWRTNPHPTEAGGLTLPLDETHDPGVLIEVFGDDLAFSRDGKRLIARDNDDTALVWRTDLEELDSVAPSVLSRNMAPTGEWDRFFPGEPYRCSFPGLPVPTVSESCLLEK